MVTCDGAGASHDLVAHLDKLARRPGHQLIYSVGWDLGERERRAIWLVPQQAWQIAVDHRGEVRERRAEDACTDRGCAHRKCWVEEAHVTELTALLRQGRAGDQLAGWPAAMRVFARRERPHPGAQLTLFEASDGWRYSLWVTEPARTHSRLARPARLHRRRPQSARKGRRRHPHRKRSRGIGKFPSHELSLNRAWFTAALTAATLLAWLRLLALDGDLAKALPRRCATASCTPPAAWCAAAAAAASRSPRPGPGQPRS